MGAGQSMSTDSRFVDPSQSISGGRPTSPGDRQYAFHPSSSSIFKPAERNCDPGAIPASATIKRAVRTSERYALDSKARTGLATKQERVRDRQAIHDTLPRLYAYSDLFFLRAQSREVAATCCSRTRCGAVDPSNSGHSKGSELRSNSDAHLSFLQNSLFICVKHKFDPLSMVPRL